MRGVERSGRGLEICLVKNTLEFAQLCPAVYLGKSGDRFFPRRRFFPVAPHVWVISIISLKFRVASPFENRKRAGNASHDASRVHARHARGSEMNFDTLDAMGNGSAPRETHRMYTRCARPPFRFLGHLVGTSSNLALTRGGALSSAPASNRRRMEAGGRSSVLAHEAGRTKPASCVPHRRRNCVPPRVGASTSEGEVGDCEIVRLE